jgi:sugar/nucleoside kinase (ribokinase family)
MFVAAGPTAARFCEWVERLGESALVLDETGRGLGEGVGLLHLEGHALLMAPDGALVRTSLDAARRQGALISIDLGPADWIRAHGSSRTAYQLATIRPDILFAGRASAAELAAPLEGIASVPVVTFGSEGCSVYGRRLVAPRGSELDEVALAAAFCVAYFEGAAPVEAAGRAVLVAAMKLAP